MIRDFYIENIRRQMSVTPTMEQDTAMRLFAEYMTCRDDHPVFILNGAAGTGKTTGQSHTGRPNLGNGRRRPAADGTPGCSGRWTSCIAAIFPSPMGLFAGICSRTLR